MREEIENLVFYCRQQLELLDAKRASLLTEIRDYRHLLEGDLHIAEPWTTIKVIERHLGNLSPTWLAILTRLSGYKQFRAADVSLVASELHRQRASFKLQSRGNVRFQLSTYVKKRLVERIGSGNYRIADKCRTALRLLATYRTPQPESTEFGPELAALAQERRVTPANPRPSRAQHERG